MIRFRSNAVAIFAALSSAAVVAVGVRGASSARIPADTARQGFDMFCGPRCTLFVLRYLGKCDTSLSQLAREIQGQDAAAGATLAAIDTALRKRGLHTLALRLRNDTMLGGNQIAILHLRPMHEDDLGHFVVLLPSSSEHEAQVWTGLAGVQRGSPVMLRKRMSGAALLVADTAVAIQNVRVIERRSYRPAVLALMVVGCAVVCSAGAFYAHCRLTRSIPKEAG